MLGIKRQQRDDDSETDQIDENDQKQNQDRFEMFFQDKAGKR
jgi:hypothetical protein